MDDQTLEKPTPEVLGRMFLAMTSVTARRFLGTFHFWGFLFMAVLPMLIAAFICIVILLRSQGGGFNTQEMEGQLTRLIANLFTGGFIHFALIFTGAVYGTSVLREELQEQTLHYFYLSTMPRWLFIVGKIAGFLAVVMPMYIVSWFMIKFLMLFPLGWDILGERMFSLVGAKLYIQEILVVAVALLTYSSIFMLLHFFLKNSVFAVFIYVWELTSNVMPEEVRYFTVVYYMKGMLPFGAAEKAPFFGMPSELPGPLLIFVVLSGVLGFTIGLSSWLASRRQCLYGAG